MLLLLPLRLEAGSAGPDEEASGPMPRIGGFTDINFFATDDDKASPQSGFQEGQFVLHFTSDLGPRLSFFGEVTLSARPSEFRAEVERSIIKYSHSDAIKISFGRYHTPINWWNTAFHHGQWLQTTAARPEMTKFGGDFIPVHFVGALVEGAIPAGGLNLNYKAGVGNGRHEIISRGGDAGDINDSRAWVVNFFTRPSRFYQLELGGARYGDRITMSSGEVSFDESITSVYAVWTRETPEILAEYARTRHEDRKTGSEYDHDAFYVQGAYRLPWWKARLKPYARYERIDVDQADLVFKGIPDRKGLIDGVRWDFADFAAAKMEYRYIRSGTNPYAHSVFTQICFAF